MNYLIIKDIKEHLFSRQRSVYYNFAFEDIKINGFSVVIYGGDVYSKPSIMSNSIKDYSHVGIHIYEEIRKQTNAVCPGKDMRFKNFEWCKFFTYINNKGIMVDSYMGQEVPVNDVCLMIKDIYKISRLKIFF